MNDAALRHSQYVAKVLDLCREYEGTKEEGGQNRGPVVERMLASVGLKPGQPWCAAGVYFLCSLAADELDGDTTCPQTGGAARMFVHTKRDQNYFYYPEHIRQGLLVPEPGDVFVRTRMGHAEDVPTVRAGHSRKGHCGFVVGYKSSGTIITFEMNTNADGSREGNLARYRELDPALPELVAFFRPGLLLTE